MRRLLTAATCVFAVLAVSMSASRATIISGTWDVTVTAWGPCPCGPPAAPVPAIASATFSFDSTVITMPGPPVPIADFSTNFGASTALFSYGPGDFLAVSFVTPLNSLFVFDFTPASINPVATAAVWLPDDQIPNITLATSFSGSFTPTSVAAIEPSALPLLMAGLGGLGLIRRHRRLAQR